MKTCIQGEKSMPKALTMNFPPGPDYPDVSDVRTRPPESVHRRRLREVHAHLRIPGQRCCSPTRLGKSPKLDQMFSQVEALK